MVLEFYYDMVSSGCRAVYYLLKEGGVPFELKLTELQKGKCRYLVIGHTSVSYENNSSRYIGVQISIRSSNRAYTLEVRSVFTHRNIWYTGFSIFKN